MEKRPFEEKKESLGFLHQKRGKSPAAEVVRKKRREKKKEYERA